MKNKNYSIQELNKNELISINGGSPFTRDLFEHFGRLFAVLSDALESDRQHGIHQCN